MGMIKEFREFAVKGNVVDMAVGIIIGGAFGKIVSSFVSGVVMPPIGLLLGGVSFSNLYVPLDGETYETMAEAVKAGAPIIKYGEFIQTIVDFIIIAFVIFMAIKGINSAKRKEEAKPAAPAAPPEDVVLLREIRDALKK
jgi:large conductance mechanosensitive channel